MNVTAYMIAHDVVDKEMRGKTYKSYLMGAKNINNEDLSDLNIEIIKNNDTEVRKLIITQNQSSNTKSKYYQC